MVVLGEGAVSYERGTPAPQVYLRTLWFLISHLLSVIYGLLFVIYYLLSFTNI